MLSKYYILKHNVKIKLLNVHLKIMNSLLFMKLVPLIWPYFDVFFHPFTFIFCVGDLVKLILWWVSFFIGATKIIWPIFKIFTILEDPSMAFNLLYSSSLCKRSLYCPSPSFTVSNTHYILKNYIFPEEISDPSDTYC